MRRIKRFVSRTLGYMLIDPELVVAYRTAIPSQIDIRVEESNGRKVARIVSVDKSTLPKEVVLVTEAGTEKDLVRMVNDLVLTYKRIPDIYRPYYKEILQPQGARVHSDSLTLVKA